MIFDLRDEAETVALAARLQRALPSDLAEFTILLQGELGAGKSTLARALLREMGHRGAVPSPTYTLVEPYQVAAGNVYHIDLYRVNSEDELQFLGWEELDDGLRLVEWPERVPGLSTNADLLVALRYHGKGRCAELAALSDKGTSLLQRLADTP